MAHAPGAVRHEGGSGRRREPRKCGLMKPLLVPCLLLAIGATGPLLAQSADTGADPGYPEDTPNSVPLDRVLILIPPRFSSGDGGTAVVCCETWNSQVGGTNCETHPICPDGWFEVVCGEDGCW